MKKPFLKITVAAAAVAAALTIGAVGVMADNEQPPAVTQDIVHLEAQKITNPNSEFPNVPKYYKCSETFVVPSIEDVNMKFYGAPDRCACSIENGTTATMTATQGYLGNFKHVTVFLTYSDGTVTRKSAFGNDAIISAEPSSSAGYITKAEYHFYLNAGTGSAAEFLEVTDITLIRG